MTRVEVNPGVCGMKARITAQANEDMEVTLSIDTACAGCQAMVEELGEVDGYEAVFCHPGEGPVYEAAVHCPHGACPVPAGLLKCIEVECKLALPRSAEIRFVSE